MLPDHGCQNSIVVPVGISPGIVDGTGEGVRRSGIDVKRRSDLVGLTVLTSADLGAQEIKIRVIDMRRKFFREFPDI